MQEMELIGLREHAGMGNIPVLLLRELEGDERILPIFIGKPEALSIALAHERVDPPRPMTHDLIKNLLGEIGLTLDRVDIVDLEDKTFFAELEFHGKDRQVRIASRPSDAIALALRLEAPIFAADKVLDEAGFVPQLDDDDDEADEADEDGDWEEPERPPEEVIEEFKNFLADISADDFEKS